MNEVVVVGLFSVLGTVIGSFGGIVASAKLTNFRLEQLEKKVDKHNSFAERMPVVEEKIENLEKEITEIKKGA